MTVVKLYAVNHLHGCLQVLTIGYYGHIFSVGLPNKWENKLLADNVTLNSSSESNPSWSAGLFRCILLCSRHAARTARFNRRLVNFWLMMQPQLRKRWTTWLRVTCFKGTLTFTQIFLYTSIFWSIMLRFFSTSFSSKDTLWRLVAASPCPLCGFLGWWCLCGRFLPHCAGFGSTYQPG